MSITKATPINVTNNVQVRWNTRKDIRAANKTEIISFASQRQWRRIEKGKPSTLWKNSPSCAPVSSYMKPLSASYESLPQRWYWGSLQSRHPSYEICLWYRRKKHKNLAYPARHIIRKYGINDTSVSRNTRFDFIKVLTTHMTYKWMRLKLSEKKELHQRINKK